jgi:hypothetical protein
MMCFDQPARSLLLLGLAAGSLLVSGREGRAGEMHFLLMFGSQRVPNNPNYSHTFATFGRASWPGNGPCPPCPRLEAFSISWLPRDLVIRVGALQAECGANFDLHATLRHVLASGERVSLWGPYQIHPELYHRAWRQAALLQSGEVLYKAIDAGHRSDRVSNCIHAVSSLAEGHRLTVASPGWGETASYLVLQRLEPWIIDPCRSHPWVGSALGLDHYPIIYRDWENPRSGALRGPLHRLFGGEKDLRATYGPPVR